MPDPSTPIERGLDFLYVCYDNEGYGNTGQQTSGATPHAARTATDGAAIGYRGWKKDLFPSKEYVDGAVVHTHVPQARVPVEEYLKRQGRFAHLFVPRRNEPVLAEIQARVDAYWRAALPQ